MGGACIDWYGQELNRKKRVKIQGWFSPIAENRAKQICQLLSSNGFAKRVKWHSFTKRTDSRTAHLGIGVAASLQQREKTSSCRLLAHR